MSNALQLDEYETIVLSNALSTGKTEHHLVSSQIQTALEDKGESKGKDYEVFQKTVARLQRRGLLGPDLEPSAHCAEVAPPQMVRNALLSAQRKIAELKESIKRKDDETSKLNTRVYQLERELTLSREKVERLSPPTVLLSKELLEQGITAFLQPDIVSKISEAARNDMTNCIRALNAGIPTAATMVSLRASEDSLRKLYEFKVGKDAGRMNWKEILEELENRSDVNKVLLGYLNYIRTQRNEAEHPGRIFTQKEAEKTFTIVLDVIGEVYKEIK